MDHKKINKKEAPSGMLPSDLEGGTKQSTESEVQRDLGRMVRGMEKEGNDQV